MKRSPLVRRTPLAASGPLARGGTLTRSAPLRRTRWARTTRTEGQELATARRVVRTRSLGRCEARTAACSGVAVHAHHVRLRSQGGTHEPSNLLDVCAPCHRHIHDHPEESYRTGLLRRGA